MPDTAARRSRSGAAAVLSPGECGSGTLALIDRPHHAKALSRESSARGAGADDFVGFFTGSRTLNLFEPIPVPQDDPVVGEYVRAFRIEPRTEAVLTQRTSKLRVST